MIAIAHEPNSRFDFGQPATITRTQYDRLLVFGIPLSIAVAIALWAWLNFWQMPNANERLGNFVSEQRPILSSNRHDQGMIAEGELQRILIAVSFNGFRADRRVINLERRIRFAQSDGQLIGALQSLATHYQLERAVALLEHHVVHRGRLLRDGVAQLSRPRWRASVGQDRREVVDF